MTKSPTPTNSQADLAQAGLELHTKLAAVNGPGQIFWLLEGGKTRYFFSNKAAYDYSQRFTDNPPILDYFTGLYADLEDES